MILNILSAVFVLLPYVSLRVLVLLHWCFQHLARISWILRARSTVNANKQPKEKLVFFFFKDAEIHLASYSWHLQLLLPWGGCSGRRESPQGWWSAREGDRHIHTFWRGKVNTVKERRCLWCVKSRSVNCGWKQIRLSPVPQTSRHTDVVKQNQMLDELTETDSSSMRTNRHCGKDSSEGIVATFYYKY